MRSLWMRLAVGLVATAALLQAGETTEAWDLPATGDPLLEQSAPNNADPLADGFLWVDPHDPLTLQPGNTQPNAAPTPPAKPKTSAATPPVSPPQPGRSQRPPVAAEKEETLRPLPPAPAPRYPPESALAYRSPAFRLASIPNMYGDFLGSAGTMSIVRGADDYNPPTGYELPSYFSYFYPTAQVELPPPGGAARLKISENNKALPSDRIYFAYSHFQGAIEASASPTVSYPIDRYVFGVEKTFLGGLWSAELRMPLASDFWFASNGFQVGLQEVGNLSVIVKRLLWQSHDSAWAIGLGIETPTGSDLTGSSGLSHFEIRNDAVHLSPFIGFLSSPEPAYFYQAFVQVDVPTNGNRVVLGDTELGIYNDQTLLMFDLSAGYWLRRNPAAFHFRGLALIGEFHYLTTLQNSDVVSGFEPVNSDLLHVANSMNRVDVVDFTVGLHAEVGQTTIRVGGVFPVKTNDERLFDAELQVQVNRYF